jgi:hypothetical protein
MEDSVGSGGSSEETTRPFVEQTVTDPLNNSVVLSEITHWRQSRGLIES